MIPSGQSAKFANLTAEQIANAGARLVVDLIACLTIKEPVSVTHFDAESRCTVVVQILPAARPIDPVIPVIEPIEDRNIEQCVLEAAPKPGQLPISRRKLAPMAGYGYNDHFLRAIRKLLADGRLVERDGRVMLPAAEGKP